MVTRVVEDSDSAFRSISSGATDTENISEVQKD